MFYPVSSYKFHLEFKANDDLTFIMRIILFVMITVFVYSAQFTVIEEMAMQHWRLCIQNKGADKGFPETI